MLEKHEIFKLSVRIELEISLFVAAQEITDSFVEGHLAIMIGLESLNLILKPFEHLIHPPDLPNKVVNLICLIL